MANITAQLIATLITANCEAYHAGQKSRDEWSAEQNRLWKLAADRLIASDVMRMVCPSLNAPMPPYSVRKQLREQTLAVGR